MHTRRTLTRERKVIAVGHVLPAGVCEGAVGWQTQFTLESELKIARHFFDFVSALSRTSRDPDGEAKQAKRPAFRTHSMLSLVSASTSFAPTPVARSPPATMQSAGTSRGTDYCKTLPAAGPFGFFDPLGLTSDLDATTVRYFREVEVKHGRVAMLGALGFVVGEIFHPLFGGGIDVPSYVAYQQTPLQEFWPSVVLSIGVFEFFSIVTFEGFGIKEEFPDGRTRIAGDFMFDPLGLKPKDTAGLEAMQAKEINNGRLAMIAMAGMVVQELVTGNKLF